MPLAQHFFALLCLGAAEALSLAVSQITSTLERVPTDGRIATNGPAWVAPIRRLVTSKGKNALTFPERCCLVRAFSGGYITGSTLHRWGYQTDGILS